MSTIDQTSAEEFGAIFDQMFPVEQSTAPSAEELGFEFDVMMAQESIGDEDVARFRENIERNGGDLGGKSTDEIKRLMAERQVAPQGVARGDFARAPRQGLYGVDGPRSGPERIASAAYSASERLGLNNFARGLREGTIEMPARGIAGTASTALKVAGNPEVAAEFDALADQISRDIQTEGSRGITGKIGQATGSLALSFAPVGRAASVAGSFRNMGSIGGSGIGSAVLAIYGLNAFGNEQADYRQIMEMRGLEPDMQDMVVHGIGAAAAEIVFEKIGLDALTKIPSSVAGKVGDALLKKNYRKAAATLNGMSVVGGIASVNAIEETLTEFANNARRKYGVPLAADPTVPDQKLTEGLGDAAMMGAFGGTVLGTPSAIVNASRFVQKGAAQTEDTAQAVESAQDGPTDQAAWEQAFDDVVGGVEGEDAPGTATPTPEVQAARGDAAVALVVRANQSIPDQADAQIAEVEPRSDDERALIERGERYGLSVRLIAAEDGMPLQRAGAYVPGSGTVVLDANAGDAQRQRALLTHEILHALEEEDSGAWQQLDKDLQELAPNLYAERKAHYASVYAQGGVEVSDQALAAEGPSVVAEAAIDTIEQLARDPDSVTEALTRNPRLGRRILTWLKKIAARVGVDLPIREYDELVREREYARAAVLVSDALRSFANRVQTRVSSSPTVTNTDQAIENAETVSDSEGGDIGAGGGTAIASQVRPVKRGEFSARAMRRRRADIASELGWDPGLSANLDEELSAVAPDLIGMNVFASKGRMPSDMREALQGQPANVRMMFSENTPGGAMDDGIGRLGTDGLIELARKATLTGETGVRDFLDRSLSANAPGAGEVALFDFIEQKRESNRGEWTVYEGDRAVRTTRDSRGAAERWARKNIGEDGWRVEEIPTRRFEHEVLENPALLPDGAMFQIEGEEFTVYTNESGAKRAQSEDADLSIELESLPIVKGSLDGDAGGEAGPREIDVPFAAQPRRDDEGIFGQRMFRSQTGAQRSMFETQEQSETELDRDERARLDEQERRTGDDPDQGTLFAAAPPVKSRAFRRWFGNSKVVDADVDPLVVYSGSTHAFSTFDASRGNPGNSFGKAVYATDSTEDLKNYSGLGPDLTQRIQLRAEQIAMDLERENPDLDYDSAMIEAEKFATEELMGEAGGVSMPLFMSLQNPADLRPDGTRLTMDLTMEQVDPDEIDQFREEIEALARDNFGLDPDEQIEDWQLNDAAREFMEEQGYEVEPTGTLVDLIEAVERVSQRFDDADEAGQYLREKFMYDFVEPTLRDVYEAMKHEGSGRGGGYATDPETGDLVFGELFRAALEEAGYDGVIHDAELVATNMRGTRDATHYIAFKPEQVKSAIGNSGAFDPDNPDIRFAVSDEYRAGFLSEQAKLRASKASVLRMIRSFTNEKKAFLVDRFKGGDGKHYATARLVSKETGPAAVTYPWRVTTFSKRGDDAPWEPWGHTIHKTKGEAIKEAAWAVDREDVLPVRFAAAFHGTPHIVDRFTTEKIGTGEGAQAYGWGLYFASNRKVAEWYRDSLRRRRSPGIDSIVSEMGLGDRESIDGGAAINPESVGVLSSAAMDLTTTVDRAAKRAWNMSRDLRGYHVQELEQIIDAYREKARGALYQVDLAPSEDEYLLWDAAIDSQPKVVRDFIEQNNIGAPEREFEWRRSTFRQVGRDQLETALVLYYRDSHGSQKGEWIGTRTAITEDGSYYQSGAYKGSMMDPLDNASQSMIERAQETLEPFHKRPASAAEQIETGKDLYNAIASDGSVAHSDRAKAASLRLLSSGIRGIKYLDGSSRAGGKWKVEVKGKSSDYTDDPALFADAVDVLHRRAAAYNGDLQRSLDELGGMENKGNERHQQLYGLVNKLIRDGAARAEHNNAYNYVIFDDEDVSITARFAAAESPRGDKDPLLGQTEDTGKPIGRPDLANPGATPEARAQADDFDEVRNQRGEPGRRHDAEVEAEADIVMRGRDIDELRKAFEAKVERGEVLSDVETVVAARITNQQLASTLSTGNQQTYTQAFRTFNAWRRSGTLAARAFRQRRDRFQSPEARYRDALMQALMLPDGSVRKRIDQLNSILNDDSASKRRKQKARDKLEHVFTREAKKLRRVRGRMAREGIDPRLVTHESMQSPVFASRVVDSARRARTSVPDTLFWIWMNNILSGLVTHSVNITSNTAFLAGRMGVQELGRAAIGSAQNAVTGDAEFTLSDWAHMWKHVGGSLAAGWTNAMRSFATNRLVFDEQITGETTPMQSIKNEDVALPIAGPSNRALRLLGLNGLPMRALMVEDQFFKTTAGYMYAYGLAHAQARQEGLRGEAMHDRIDELLSPRANLYGEELLDTDIFLQSLEMAREVVFQDDPSVIGRLGGRIRSTRGLDPVARFLIPFVNTVDRIFIRGFEISPVAFVATPATLIGEGRKAMTGEGADSRKVAMAITNGMLALGLLAALASWKDDEDGLPRITGTRSPDWRDIPEQYRTAPPMSIRIGNKWVGRDEFMRDNALSESSLDNYIRAAGFETRGVGVDLEIAVPQWYSYRRIEPFATGLGLAIDFLDNMEQGDSFGDAMAGSFESVLNLTKDATFLRTVGEVFELLDNSDRAAEILTGIVVDTFVTPWVPNLFKQATRAADPKLADTREAKDAPLWKRALADAKYDALPLSSMAPTPRYDIWGRPIERGAPVDGAALGFMYRLVAPIQVSDANLHPVDLMFIRYNQKVRDGLIDRPDETVGANEQYEVHLRQPSRYFTRRGERIDLGAEDYQRMLRETGQEASERLLSMNLNIEDPSPRDIERVDRVFTRIRERWKDRYWRERRSDDE